MISEQQRPAKRMFVLEFNELCPSLLDELMRRGQLPNFRRLYQSSTIYTTDAMETAPNLEPWIQWPTVHSGLPFGEHGVFLLGEGRMLGAKCVAEILSDAGIRVGVFGSMNLNYGPLNGYMIPDPWDKEGRAHPEWLSPFHETVSRQVQESSTEAEATRAEMQRFGLFLLTHGLSVRTIRSILWQLLHERADRGVRWRRAVLLDQLQYDVFRQLNRQLDIQFGTLFLNSTAHFQHYYWRNMQPDQFDVPPPDTDHKSLADAIQYGYRAMDRIVGRFLKDYPDAVLLLATALSQQPWSETTKCTFRPRRFEELLEFAGISAGSATVRPVMAEQFHLDFADESAAEAAQGRLLALTVGRQPLMTLNRDGKSLFAGCAITDATAVDHLIRRNGNGSERKLGEMFHMVHSMRSGRHHPDGVLWIRNGRHRVIGEKVPLINIAPTILSHFGVEPLPSMKGVALPTK
jgi:hypothetical protein